MKSPSISNHAAERGKAMNDPYNLERFVEAQKSDYEIAFHELSTGKKRTHWIWYVFPQIRGLGHSTTAEFYGIGSLDEARAYLGHPLLGDRLAECTHAVIESDTPSLHDLFGSPDDMKFCSSMTLFALAANGTNGLFQKALDRWCHGKMDEKTLALVWPEPSV
jgi:uncharacterized protein (DUF1810 family)